MSRDVYVFLGPPGSGKGSLSALCIEKFEKWIQLSTGDLCRKHIAEQTAIGKKIDFTIKFGKLVDDELITDMVFDWFETAENNQFDVVILDGYPRTVHQAQSFGDALEAKFPDVTLHVILFDVDDDVVIQRISTRGVCDNKHCQSVYNVAKDSLIIDMICTKCSCPVVRRKDDQVEAVKKRLVIYHNNVNQLLAFYRKKGVDVIALQANLPLDQVFKTFSSKYVLSGQ